MQIMKLWQLFRKSSSVAVSHRNAKGHIWGGEPIHSNPLPLSIHCISLKKIVLSVLPQGCCTGGQRCGIIRAVIRGKFQHHSPEFRFSCCRLLVGSLLPILLSTTLSLICLAVKYPRIFFPPVTYLNI